MPCEHEARVRAWYTGEGGRKTSSHLRGAELRADADLGYDSLLIALKENPAPAILELIARLIPSSPFAIYHQSIQPLAECEHAMHKAKCAVNMNLFDSWHRKYQVAENRTHPEMTTYPPTGYVLTGISVVPPPPREPPIPPRAASGLGVGAGPS